MSERNQKKASREEAGLRASLTVTVGQTAKEQEVSQLTLLQKERVKLAPLVCVWGGRQREREDGHSLSQLKSPDEIPDIDTSTQGR